MRLKEIRTRQNYQEEKINDVKTFNIFSLRKRFKHLVRENSVTGRYFVRYHEEEYAVLQKSD